MKLIVGLGNPGREYEKTRHNVGFMVVDNYISNKGLEFNKNKFSGLSCETSINNEKVIFLKPQKYMNLSGEVVRDYVKFYKINIDDILIINDDLDLPIGKIKLREHGSCGGHNGLRNIESNLGSNNYKRLKIGISNDKSIETKDYVLGKFSREDYDVLEDAIKISANIIDDFLSMDFDRLMNKYNKKN